MQKLIDQFDFDGDSGDEQSKIGQVSEDRATLLFLIDTYNKHLFEIDSHPVRKVREVLDNFAKELLDPKKQNSDRVLFRFRQFFSSYRIDEYTYLQKTFEEFRSIVWDFVDQLGEDINYEKNSDKEILENLEELREAVESNSIDDLKTQSRQFIDFYTEYQTKKDEHKSQRLESIKSNLSAVKKQLTEANNNMRLDHLTSAYNRKSFDEQISQLWNLHQISQTPVSLVMLDIDHFKKVNDNYGHAIGDFVIKECVKQLQDHFGRDQDFVSRVGGEEFAVILPDYNAEQAAQKSDEVRKKIQSDVLVQDGVEIRFTISLGVAQLQESESIEIWMKRADSALYESKNTGRNKVTIAPKRLSIGQVA